MRLLAYIVALSLLLNGAALADCAALGERAKILAADLSKKKELITQYKEKITALTAEHQSATGNEKSAIAKERDDAKSELDAALTQHESLVLKIEKAGTGIRRECGLE